MNIDLVQTSMATMKTTWLSHHFDRMNVLSEAIKVSSCLDAEMDGALMIVMENHIYWPKVNQLDIHKDDACFSLKYIGRIFLSQ